MEALKSGVQPRDEPRKSHCDYPSSNPIARGSDLTLHVKLPRSSSRPKRPYQEDKLTCATIHSPSCRVLQIASHEMGNGALGVSQCSYPGTLIEIRQEQCYKITQNLLTYAVIRALSINLYLIVRYCIAVTLAGLRRDLMTHKKTFKVQASLSIHRSTTLLEEIPNSPRLPLTDWSRAHPNDMPRCTSEQPEKGVEASHML